MAGESTNSRLTSVQIRLQNNQFTEEIPISVLASNIIYDPGGGNVSGGVNYGYNLTEILGNVNMNTLNNGGSLQAQINNLKSNILNVPSVVENWLENHYHASGDNITTNIYLDTEGAVADAKAAGSIVKVSDSQPTEPANKIWIKPSVTSVTVPTMQDIENIVAPQYSDSSPYNIGDYVIHNDLLYKCTTAISSSGELWTSGHWTQVNVGTEIGNLKSDTDYNISSLASNVDGSNQKLHFEQGSLSSGIEQSSAIRIRTSYLYIGHLQAVKIKPVNGYKTEVDLFNENKTYKTYMGWTTEERIVKPGNNTYNAYYIRILLCKSDNSAIVPNEANGNIEITTYSNFTNRLEKIDVNNYNIDSILALTDGSQQTVSFELGTLSGGNEDTSSIRIRTPLIYIAHLDSIKVQALNGYKLEVDIYNTDKSYKTYLGWSTEQRILKPGTGTYDGDYLRFILAKSDDSAIVPSDAEGNISIVAYPKLKSAFNLVYKTIGYDFINLKDYSNWQIGSRSSSGEITTLQNRIVSVYKKVKKGSIVFSMWNIEQNYGKYFLDAMIFDSNFNLISDSGWTRQIYTIPEDGFLSLVVKKLDDSNIIEAEIEGIVDDVFFTENPKNIDKWDFDEGSTIKAINHRGWHEAPENTLPAYIQSHEHGFRYVETDVRFTSDGIPVCLHDATLNRTCRYADGSTLTQTINIYDITYAEAQEYDAGIWKSASYTGTKIPSLFDFLLLCKRLNLLPYIDMGATPRMTKQNLQAIINTVSKCGMTGKVTYLAPDLEIAIMITQTQKNARVCTINSLNPVYINYYKALMTGYNQAFANTYYPELITERIENCRALGIPVETWTVNDTSIIDGLDAYISGVTSDSINVNHYWENMLINH